MYNVPCFIICWINYIISYKNHDRLQICFFLIVTSKFILTFQHVHYSEGSPERISYENRGDDDISFVIGPGAKPNENTVNKRKGKEANIPKDSTTRAIEKENPMQPISFGKPSIQQGKSC